MARPLNVVTASKGGDVITKTGFSGYDHCLNTYVGCEFGCKYCYVRFFVKDKEHPWGEFVRSRRHIPNKLLSALKKVGPTRLVLGTMTDPYQPQELKERLTRTALEHIIASDVQGWDLHTKPTSP